MEGTVKKKVQELKEQIVEATRELVRIRSVEGEPVDGQPFGAGINQALETALKLGEDLGLDSKNVAGYAGHVEYGQGEEILGILCHLDIVPEGSGWAYPPYQAELVDGKIYGRGTIDNKGPAVAAIYALKAVKDLGIELNKRVRVILGTDEESGWEGLEYYFEHEEEPDIAFSPDAQYPVIHAEKGIMIFKLQKAFSGLKENGAVRLVSLQGGNAPNMVPDFCEAILEVEDVGLVSSSLERFLQASSCQLEIETAGGEVKIKSYGVSSHGSLPEHGQNAISGLFSFLATLPLPEDGLKEFVEFYQSRIGMEYYGESIGCQLEDEVSGRLVFNVGMAKMDRERAKLVINIRYPVTYTEEHVYRGIEEGLAGTGISLKKGEHKEPLYVAKDDPLVRKLMQVYRDVTGDEDSEPIAIGGGTYARAIEKAVAFGALFPGQPELAHQKDEYIGVDDLLKNTEIYVRAIIALAGE